MNKNTKKNIIGGAIIAFIVFAIIFGKTTKDKESENNTGTNVDNTASENSIDLTKEPSQKTTSEPTDTTTPKPTEVITPKEDTLANVPEEERVIRQHISDSFTYTEITSVTLNPDYGTEKENDYVALVYVTWNQKNSLETSKQVLAMYSEDLAAIVAEKASNVQEIAVFWTIPYLDMNAKYSYERRDKGMYITDEIWS